MLFLIEELPVERLGFVFVGLNSSVHSEATPPKFNIAQHDGFQDDLCFLLKGL